MRRFLLAPLFVLLMAEAAISEVRPEQVAVVANRNSKESQAIAKHYLKERSLPEENILLLDLPANEETISRELYEQKIVAPIRYQLKRKKIADKVRVLVTTIGIPLRVLAPEVTDDDKQIALDAQAKQKLARSALMQIQQQATNIARVGEAPEEEQVSSENGKPDAQINQELIAKVRKAISEAASRLNGLKEPEAKSDGTAKLSPLVLRFGGLAALVRNLNAAKSEQSASSPSVVALKNELGSAEKLLRALDQTGVVQERPQAYALTERMFGLAGVLLRAERETEHREYQNGDASVDSELALLWWERQMYKVASRLPNPLYFNIQQRTQGKTMVLPVIMVSRLDGPLLENVLAMLKNSLQAEKDGLKGKAFIDSRGLKFKGGDTYSIWDQDLKDLASLLQSKTDYAVMLDENEKLLAEAKDTAIYAGWYQLRNYEDVFSFSPGSIAFHIASEEAVSIHDLDEKGWCKNMLQRGVSATLGAIAEPYLDSFPLPQKFFALLLSGSYSLVEAYYLTTPYISWRMVLFGDPLYNPWRDKKLVAAADINERIPNAKMDPFPPAPASLVPGDPSLTLHKIKEEREALRRQLDGFFNKVERQMKNLADERKGQQPEK